LGAAVEARGFQTGDSEFEGPAPLRLSQKETAKGTLLATGKRGLKQSLKGRQRTVVLFTDATIITETPPLRARRASVVLSF
jgi:hypothetical protein